MTLNQLECFLALAERLNFTLTANDLFMAQTTLSRSISALEQELGVQLFHRTSRAVELTPAGQAFRAECAKMLDDYRRAVSAAHHAQQGFRGKLTLGVLQDNFDELAIRIFRAMKEQYPEISLTVREYNHSRLVSKFLSGRLDAIIDSGSFDLTPEVDMVLLNKNQQCAVFPADWPQAQRQSIRVEELRELPFVTMSQSASQPGYSFLWQTVTKAGFVPKIAGEACHIPTLLMLVASGLGLTFLMDSIRNPAEDMIRFVPLEDIPPSLHALLWMKDNENPSLPRMVAAVRELYPCRVF